MTLWKSMESRVMQGQTEREVQMLGAAVSSLQASVLPTIE